MAEESVDATGQSDQAESFASYLGSIGQIESPLLSGEDSPAPSQESSSSPEIDYSLFENIGLTEDQVRSVPTEVLGKVAEALGIQLGGGVPGFNSGMMPNPLMPGMPGVPGMPGMPGMPMGVPGQYPMGYMTNFGYQQNPTERSTAYQGPEKFKVELNEDEFGPGLRDQLSKMNDHYHNQVVQMEEAIGAFYQQWQNHQQQERAAYVQEKLSSLSDDWRTTFGRGQGATPWQRHYRNAVHTMFDNLAANPQFASMGRESLFQLALQYTMPDQYRKVEAARLAKQQKPNKSQSPSPRQRTSEKPTQKETNLIDQFGLDSDGIREVLFAQRQMDSKNVGGVFGG